MPIHLTCARMAVLAAAIVPAMFSAGCRGWPCQKVSDDGITAARQLSLQGLDAQQRGQWDKAEALFASAVMKCPADERARCGYAQSLWLRGAHDEAIRHMEEVARLSGSDPERLVELGQMHRQRGDVAKAAALAERAIAINPHLAAAWALRGEVLQAQGKRSEALASYYRALSYEHPPAEVRLAIAEIHMSENRPQRALATLQALSAEFPPGQAPVDLVMRESQALQALGRHQESARALAQAAAQSNPVHLTSTPQSLAAAAAPVRPH